MTTSDTRRERQLGWVTADLQRYGAEHAADWLDAIRRQICPFCGSGPGSRSDNPVSVQSRGCGQPHKGHGLCRPHLRASRRTADEATCT